MRRRTHLWKTYKIKDNTISDDVVLFIMNSPDHVLNYYNYVRYTEFVGDVESLTELHDKFYKDLPFELKLLD